MSNESISTLSAVFSVSFAAGALTCLVAHLLQLERKRKDELLDLQVSLMNHAKSLAGFSIDAAVYSLYGCVLIAIDQVSDSLLVACGSTDAVRSKIWRSSEIVSAEVVTNIGSDAILLGGTLSESGERSPSGRQSIPDLSGAWLKLLVKDISNPWVIIPMPTVAEADRWKGIVTLVARRAA